MAEIDKLFKLMVDKHSSDMHLSAGSPPYLRVHGDMVAIHHPPLNNEDIQALVFEILNEKQKRGFVENWELDCSYQLNGVGRFRVNVFLQRRGMGAVFRVIPEVIKTIEELGLPPSLHNMIDAPRGLILVTGPTGSGKSTTLASLIHTINVTRKEHIITIEDPIEFVHENKGCLINQREVSSHTKSFANALKASLREDPDIILVGELRDLETIQLAMTAAETGHLVFGTLHTNSAPKTVDRIIDVFPEQQQAQIRTMLAESLRGVIAQALFKRADKPGRIAAIEVMVNTSAVANLIREGKTFQIPSQMQTGSNQGMITFESNVIKLAAEGKISKADAETYIGKKKSSTDNDVMDSSPKNTYMPPPVHANTGIKIHPTPATSAVQSLTNLVKKKIG
ncbi:MAG: type IV pilus twitching motility protein PilT [Bdellovibrionales bacterium]|nr:type IV pilus twitching motility protein PilT [Bdellovibrionales bacterium]